MKLERVDKSISRIVDGDGKVIGFAMLMSNGRWGAFSTDEVRLTSASFAKTAEVLAFFKDAALEGGKTIERSER